MRVSVEHTGKLARKLRIEAPEARITAELDKRLRDLARTTRVQGFRPGKAPFKVIRGRYGGQVRREVVGELVRLSLFEAIDQEGLQPVAAPEIHDLADKAGQDLSFTATLEIYPEVNLQPLAGVRIEKPVAAVSEADIDAMIGVLRQARRELVPVARAAAPGDVVEINFESFVEGRAITNGKAENHRLELGSHDLGEEFEAGLAGKAAGAEVTLHVAVPEDNMEKELRGREVEYRIRVRSVNEAVLPALDAKFMAAFGVEDGDEARFRADLRRGMERELDAALQKQIRARVLDKLHEIHAIELPEALVAAERRRIQQEWEAHLKKRGIEPSPEAGEIPARQQAEKRVSLQLILGEIIRQNDLKADPAEVRQRIEQLAAGYAEPEAVINWHYSSKENLARVEELVLEDAVINWALAHAEVTEKTSTFDEITNKGQTDSRAGPATPA